MEQLLNEKGGLRYLVSDTFEGSMLVPVIKNILYKAENDWDDYDEVSHCCRLIEAVRKDPDMKMDFHFIKRGEDTIGAGLITYGAIDMQLFFSGAFSFTDPIGNIVIFNYFHIAPEGRGTGEYWLRDIILPHYYGKGFTALYVKSSHPKVFSLYGRLGTVVGEYRGKSDNGLYTRQGKIFRIPIAE